MYLSFSNYRSFIAHQTYIHNSSLQIQPWMNPETIQRNFNIPPQEIFKELNTTNTTKNLRTPISKICIEQSLNCTQIIDKLNSQII